MTAFDEMPPSAKPAEPAKAAEPAKTVEPAKPAKAAEPAKAAAAPAAAAGDLTPDVGGPPVDAPPAAEEAEPLLDDGSSDAAPAPAPATAAPAPGEVPYADLLYVVTAKRATFDPKARKLTVEGVQASEGRRRWFGRGRGEGGEGGARAAAPWAGSAPRCGGARPPCPHPHPTAHRCGHPVQPHD